MIQTNKFSLKNVYERIRNKSSKNKWVNKKILDHCEAAPNTPLSSSLSSNRPADIVHTYLVKLVTKTDSRFRN